MDGNVMLSTELDTRPVEQSLSNLKRKIVEVFKGADVKTLSASMRAVNAEIKATEAQARKAQAALDALMSGDTEPQAVKNIQKEIDLAEKQAQKLQGELDALLSGDTQPKSTRVLEQELKKAEAVVAEMTPEYERLLADAELWAGRDMRFMTPDDLKTLEAVKTEFISYQNKFNAAKNTVAELRAEIADIKLNPALSPEAEELEFKIQELVDKSTELKATQEAIRQSPLLTAEAKKYGDALAVAKNRLTELRNAQEELEASAQNVGLATRLQQNSVVNGFQHIERRIIGLAKRVFFFTLITKALRAVRSQVSALIANDTQLSSSLAVVKGNLATAFGTIWVTALPAIRALINFLAKATSYLVAFISWLTGKSFKQGQQAMQSISNAAGNTAGNTGKIGKAAKKAAKALNRMLLPFDQMNVLSKDTADNAGGGGSAGGGGGAGGVGGAAGITWPKEMDRVMAKFEKFKDLILLIGAAFAAWKLTNIIAKLLGITDAFKKFKLFVGLAALIAGIALLVRGIRDLKKNGPTVENICDIIAGAFLTIGGAILLLTGATGFGAILIAIGLVVLAFKNLYKNFKPFRKYIDGALKRIKKAFSKGKFAGFKQIGKEIILGILNGIVWVVKKIGGWIKKHVVEPFKKWFKKKFGIHSPAKEMLDIGKNIALGILNGILEPFKKIGEWIQEHVLIPIKEALFGDGEDKEGFFVSIGAKFSDTKEAIKEKWENITSDVKDKVAEMKAEVKQKWNDIKTAWTNLTSNIQEKTADMKAAVKQRWDDIKKAWTDLTSNVAEKVADMKAEVKQKWSDIKDKWNNIVSNIKDKAADMKATIATKWSDIKDKWHNIIDNINDKVADMKAKVASKWSDLKDEWHGITKHIKTKTADMKAKVATKWSSIRSTWNSLMSHFKDKTAYISLKFSAAAQDLKNWINANVIDRINSHIPGTLKNMGFSVPRLAQGAVIPANKEFLAMLGDQKRGVNIETPLETMVDAFNTALKQNGYNGNQNVNVYLQGDAKQLFRVVRVEANNYTQSTGKAAFNL